MQVSDYQFFRIFATCDKLIKDILPMLADVRTSNRIAYTAYVLDVKAYQNVSIVVGISNDSYQTIASHMAYIGYVMCRYNMVPEHVEAFTPPADVDLTSTSCFMDDLPF